LSGHDPLPDAAAFGAALDALPQPDDAALAARARGRRC
jgi:hypothetical protein